MVTSMLEKAIEIEGLLRIIRDGNPLPETYILLNIKAAELAEQALCLEERATATTKEGGAPDDKAGDAPEVMAPEENASEAKEPEEKVSGENEEAPEAPEAAAEASAETQAQHADFRMQKEPEDSNGTEDSNVNVKVDFLMATEETAPLPSAVVFTDEEPSTEERQIKSPELTVVSASEAYLDLDELEFTEEDDILLDLETSASDTDIYSTHIPEATKADGAANGQTEKDEAVEAMTEPEAIHAKPEETQSAYSRTEAKTQSADTGHQKQKTKLKSAFSLNDRFLYSRELFEGNMKMFDSTLEFIEGIEDYSIIEDYFYSELEWDPENTHVAAFMEILRPHFRE